MSIPEFAEQIEKSALAQPDGYLARFERESELQARFARAIDHMIRSEQVAKAPP